MEGALARLIATHARAGTVEWIGVHPARREPVTATERTEGTAEGRGVFTGIVTNHLCRRKLLLFDDGSQIARFDVDGLDFHVLL